MKSQSFTKVLTKQTLLFSSVLVQTLCADSDGAMRDNLVVGSNYPSNVDRLDDHDSNEDFSTTTETYVRTSTQFVYPSPFSPWSDFSTAKIVTLFLISFSIPIIFMILLFWRLQREKKYLNARAGALVYRETVLVPSYTRPDADQTSSSANDFNVVQMHTALFDTPPDYDEVTRNGIIGSETIKSKSVKTEDVPPPSYSTVYM